MLKLIETYSTGDYSEVEVFECLDCGRTHSVQSGGDIACCPCEFIEAPTETNIALYNKEG